MTSRAKVSLGRDIQFSNFQSHVTFFRDIFMSREWPQSCLPCDYASKCNIFDLIWAFFIFFRGTPPLGYLPLTFSIFIIFNRDFLSGMELNSKNFLLMTSHAKVSLGRDIQILNFQSHVTFFRDIFMILERPQSCLLCDYASSDSTFDPIREFFKFFRGTTPWVAPP